MQRDGKNVRMALNILLGRFSGKRTLGRSRCRREDSRIYLKELIVNKRIWIDLTYIRDYR